MDLHPRHRPLLHASRAGEQESVCLARRVHVGPDYVAPAVDSERVRRCGSRVIDRNEIEGSARAELDVGSEDGNPIAQGEPETMTLLRRVGIGSYELTG